MRKFAGLLVLAFLVLSCVTGKRALLTKTFKEVTKQKHFVGFKLFDPTTQKTIYSYNANKYFLPASNTKIFTLYTGLMYLPDTIPALHYNTQNDTIFVQPTGDPTLLYPNLYNDNTILFLKNHPYKTVVIQNNAFYDDAYAPGWSWDDYAYYYMPQRSAFPIHGNLVSLFFKEDSLNVSPILFKDSVVVAQNPYPRDLNQNKFYIEPTEKDTLFTPFIVSDTITKKILEKLTSKTVRFTDNLAFNNKNTLYSVPTDSLLKIMMVESDNFLAEQIHVMVSGLLFDSLSVKKSINHVLKNNLKALPEKPRWVDGSGLSRYNLFTPNSMVYVLNELNKNIPQEKLFNLFPVGGVSGTLKNWYGASTPYVFAKSGSMSNNYCLSGYIITKSGKTLIFSYMANHFRVPSSNIRQDIANLLLEIHNRF